MVRQLDSSRAEPRWHSSMMTTGNRTGNRAIEGEEVACFKQVRKTEVRSSVRSEQSVIDVQKLAPWLAANLDHEQPRDCRTGQITSRQRATTSMRWLHRCWLHKRLHRIATSQSESRLRRPHQSAVSGRTIRTGIRTTICTGIVTRTGIGCTLVTPASTICRRSYQESDVGSAIVSAKRRSAYWHTHVSRCDSSQYGQPQ